MVESRGGRSPDQDITCPSTGWRARMQALGRRLDLPAHLARWLEPRFQRWWVPAILLAFPVLLLILAVILTSLR